MCKVFFADRELECQPLEHFLRRQPRGHVDSHAVTHVLVNQHEEPPHPTILRSAPDEVVGPDVIPMRRSKSDARAIVEPQPRSDRPSD